MFMRYATARYKTEQREAAYRFYVSECLKIISENTANYGGGKFMNKSLYDVLNSHGFESAKNAEEIIDDIVKRAGIEVIE